MGNKANSATSIPAIQSTPELESHIRGVDPSVPRSRGIGGAHNCEVFYQQDIQITKTVPSKEIPGVTYHEYTLPILGKDSKPVGGYGTRIHKKTVYHPKIFPHEEYMRRGLEAAKEVYQRSDTLPNRWEGHDSKGVKWIGYATNGNVTSFFPDVPLY